jgi:hypothetical protein
MVLRFDFNKNLDDLVNNGITTIENCIDDRVLSDLRIKFDRLVKLKSSNAKAIGSTEEDEMIWIDHPMALDRNLLKIASCEHLSKLIGQYLNTDIQLGYTFAYRTKVLPNITPEIQSLIKRPGVFKGWHSDANLTVPTRGYRCVVVMIYLSDVEKGDGGLWIVEGSQNYGGSRREWDEDQFDQTKVKEVVGKAGTVIVFDMEMIHRAGTPSKSIPRDVVRFMYTPFGGYSEDYLLPASFVDEGLTEAQRRLLKFSTTSSNPVLIAEERVDSIPKNINFISFVRKQLIKLLV